MGNFTTVINDDVSTREIRRQRTHQAILDAARQIIARKGIDGLSMRAIAKQIDYSPAGLYEYFGSKEEIVSAVCEQGHARLTQTMRRVDLGLPVDDYLQAIGVAYIEFAQRNPDHFMLMFNNPSTGTPLGLDKDQVLSKMSSEDSSFGVLLQAIQRGIDEGIFQTRPGYGTLEMAHTAWSMVHGMAMLRIGHLRNFPMDFAQVEHEGLRRIGLALQQP